MDPLGQRCEPKSLFFPSFGCWGPLLRRSSWLPWMNSFFLSKNGEVTRKTKENYRCFDWKSMKHLDLNWFKLNQKRGCHQAKFGFHQPKMGKFMTVPHLETEKWSSKEEFRIMLFAFTASCGFKSSGEESEESTQIQLSADYIGSSFLASK